MAKYLICTLISIVAVTILSCKTSTSPQGEGTLEGQTYLVDTLGNRLPPFSNISVEVLGTSLETTTDSLGEWEIDNVPNGTQTLRFSKPGFGDDEQFGVAVPGPGVTFVPNTCLGYARTDLLAADSVSYGFYAAGSDAKAIIVYGHPLTYSEYPRLEVLLLSPDSTLSQSSPRTFVSLSGNVPFSPSNGFGISVSESELQSLGISSGTPVFATFCCAGAGDPASEFEPNPYLPNTSDIPSYYWDANLRHYVSTACSPHGNVISGVAP
jgi:hypothetical protein